jgi:hypothetical protein
MNEEKILFKCNSNGITNKEFYEAICCIKKKALNRFKTGWISAVILIAIFHIWDLVYNWDFFLIEAISIILSDKLFIITVILCTLIVWNTQRAEVWLALKIANITRKDIERPDTYIYFYQTFYEITLFSIKTKSYHKMRINYSDISDSNFYTSENMYIIHIPKPKSLRSITVVRKNSFITGTEQEFIKFIYSKIASNHIESK